MGLLSPVMFCLLAAASLEMTEGLSVVPLACYRGTDLKIYCGRGSSGKCPGESYCDIDPVDRFATCCCTDISAFCPNCTKPVNCLIDPCRYSTCRAYPSAVCRSDYCGGCNARFYQGKTEVTDRCNDITPCSRRGGRPLRVSCGRGSPGPCPGSSYCDIHPTDVFAVCCCNDTAATCPDCTRPYNCKANPCSVSSCPAFPRAMCRPDYCGGCKARYYQGKREVTNQCNDIKPCSRRGGKPLNASCGRGSPRPCPGVSYCDIHPTDAFAVCCCNDTAATCPGCTYPVRCLVNPCSVSSCPAFPRAMCRSDYCGGCKARYYQGKREVTNQCNDIKPCSRRGGKPLSASCGRGSPRPCPGVSYCDIHPTDAFAVCCCNDTAAYCPGCTYPVRCFVNPCSVSSCPAIPSARCRPDYCGGCRARYYVRYFYRYWEVTSLCHRRG